MLHVSCRHLSARREHEVARWRLISPPRKPGRTTGRGVSRSSFDGVGPRVGPGRDSRPDRARAADRIAGVAIFDGARRSNGRLGSAADGPSRGGGVRLGRRLCRPRRPA